MLHQRAAPRVSGAPSDSQDTLTHILERLNELASDLAIVKVGTGRIRRDVEAVQRTLKRPKA